MQEANANLFAVNLAVEIHQVGFHRYFRSPPNVGRTPNVGYGSSPLAFNQSQSDVAPFTGRTRLCGFKFAVA